ncbi:MAG: hypothetical protein JWP01_3902 [Myxococcales bacterium]|nr:hypothetical protein [Myxococcales bacterium]
MRSTLLAALVTVGMVGCVGGIESGGGPDPLESPDGDGNDNGDNPAGSDLTAAKQLFDTGVFPVLEAKCSGGACHAETAQGSTLTRFVATDPANGWTIATNYTALVGNYAASAAPILTKVKPGTHQGVTGYTPDEETKITAWLNKEVELRNGQPMQPTTPGVETLSAATERVLSEFAGCMSLTNFKTANMAQAWGNLNANNNQQCENCHATGGEGFIATQQEALFYNVVSTKKYFFLQYLTVDLTGGAEMAKVIMNTVSFKGVSEGLDPHREHPRFNAATNQGMTALKNFYDATMARKAIPAGMPGACDAPRPLSNL